MIYDRVAQMAQVFDMSKKVIVFTFAPAIKQFNLA
jgi:hypothetical protein